MSPILKDTDTGARDRAAPPPEAVKAELERILASEEFVASDRLKHFLRFVVEETLAGRANRLKAYTIALEVLGRGASFDPQNDPVVRMEAGKLRRRLGRPRTPIAGLRFRSLASRRRPSPRPAGMILQCSRSCCR